MKLQIICECGEIKTLNEDQMDDFWIHDTTPCSCGRCHGERYEIDFEKCKKCGKELTWEKEQ